VIGQRIERNQGIPINTGEPIVVYREAPQQASREVEGISPNRHNRFYISIEQMDDDIVDTIKKGEASMDMPELERREALQDAGMDKDTSQDIEHIHGTNIPVDQTKGIQHLNETMELLIEGLEDALDDGPLAAEPVQGALLRLHDARLPRTPSTAVRHRSSRDARGRPQRPYGRRIRLLEPIQDVRIDVPNDHMGAASGEIQGRRGRVDDMYQEGDLMVVEGIAPVDEMIGFSSDIRSARPRVVPPGTPRTPASRSWPTTSSPTRSPDPRAQGHEAGASPRHRLLLTTFFFVLRNRRFLMAASELRF